MAKYRLPRKLKHKIKENARLHGVVIFKFIRTIKTYNKPPMFEIESKHKSKIWSRVRFKKELKLLQNGTTTRN